MPTDEPRYMVQSEQVRDEPRVFWVVDRHKAAWRNTGVTGATTNKRQAERECDRLNGSILAQSSPDKK
jgi:hypothetical protein